MEALLVSFAVIFVAELGDKSQLMALAFATRYRCWVVLSAIAAPTTLVHLMSVGIGVAFGAALPTRAVNVVAGIAFLGFGLWTLRGDELTDDEVQRAGRSTGSAFLAVSGAFLLAELGDKTMLATITLAADSDWLGTWVGSTLGMVAADALAIGVGALLGRTLPERAVRIGAAVLFFAFGALLIAEGVLG